MKNYNEIRNAIPDAEHLPLRPSDGAMVFKYPSGNVFTAIGGAWVNLEVGKTVSPSPWTPAAGAEYPALGSKGDQHVITKLLTPFTTATAGPNGEPPIGTVLDNGDRLVQNAAGGFDVLPAPKVVPKVPTYGTAGVDYKTDTLLKQDGVLYVVTQDFTDSGRTLAQEIAAGNISELHPDIQTVINETTATAKPVYVDNIIVDKATGLPYIVLVDSIADTIANLLTASKIAPMGGAGGVYEWVTGDDYKVDTIVVDPITHVPYMALKDFTGGATVSADVLALNMELISKPTKTVPWVAATAYTQGSMVYGTGGEGLFIVVNDYTSGVDIATDVTNLNLVPAVVIPPELGGVVYNILTPYKIGDIVSHSGIAYVAIQASTGIIPSTPNNTDWVSITDGLVHKDGSVKFDDHAIIGDGSGPAILNLDSAVGSNSEILFRDATGVVEGKIEQTPTGRIVIEQAKAEDIEFVLPADQMLTSKVGGVWHGVAYNDLSSWVTAVDFVKNQLIESGGSVYLATVDFTSAATFDLDLAAGNVIPVGAEVKKKFFLITATQSTVDFGETLGNDTTVFVNGNLLEPSDFTVSGQIVTYVTALSANDTTTIFSKGISGTTPTLTDERGGVAYNDLLLYKIGDVVSVTGELYMCKTVISVPEVFDPLKWDAIAKPITSATEQVNSNTLTYTMSKDITPGVVVMVNGQPLLSTEFSFAGKVITILNGGLLAYDKITVLNGIEL